MPPAILKLIWICPWNQCILNAALENNIHNIQYQIEPSFITLCVTYTDYSVQPWPKDLAGTKSNKNRQMLKNVKPRINQKTLDYLAKYHGCHLLLKQW